MYIPNELITDSEWPETVEIFSNIHFCFYNI